jgi:hypothetical protein
MDQSVNLVVYAEIIRPAKQARDIRRRLHSLKRASAAM